MRPDASAVTAAPPAPHARSTPSAGRLAFPDALRGFAALWVVLFHIGASKDVARLQAALPAFVDAAIFRAGHFGVPVFFVLSGFVIALSIGRDAVDARYLGRFALRRAVRLDLPYWAAIAITLVLLAVKRQLFTATAVPEFTPSNVLAHMFYLQQFLGFRAINPVFWTLSYEIQFYLAFCALLAVAHRWRSSAADRRSQHALFMLAALVALVAPLVPALHVRGLALASWYGFLLGVFVAWSLDGTIRTLWLVAFAAALCGVWARTGDTFVIVCVITAVLLLLVGRAGHLRDWCTAAPLQFLGRVSYSLYLLHVPVSGAAFYLASPLRARGPGEDFVAMLFVLAVNVAVAWAFWWLVERPSTALAKRLRKH